jgi:hypothetical protein
LLHLPFLVVYVAHPDEVVIAEILVAGIDGRMARGLLRLLGIGTEPKPGCR